MRTAKLLRILGSLAFLLVWIPFGMIFLRQFVLGDNSERAQGGLFNGNGIWIGLCIFFALAAAVFLAGSLIAAAVARNRILKNGVDADAVIIRLKETGTRINGNPVVDIFLEVRPATQSAFPAETRRTVSVVDLPSFQPGRLVAVKYIPGTDQAAIIGPKLEIETA